MSEHKEFDDYVKGLFDKDPKVPAGLDWESMGFDLPKPSTPEKKPWRRYFWLLLLPLLFGTCSLGYFYFGNSNLLPLSESTQNSSNIEMTTTIPITATTKEANSNSNEKNGLSSQDTEASNEELNSSSIVVNADVENVDVIAESLAIEKPSNNLGATLTSPTSFTKDSNITTGLLEDISGTSQNEIDWVNDNSEILIGSSNEQIINNTITLEHVNRPLLIDETDSIELGSKRNLSINTLTELSLLPILWTELNLEKRNTRLELGYFDSVISTSYSIQRKFKFDAIYVGFGYSELDAYEADSIGLLDSYINPGVGQTFYVGVRMNLFNRINTNLKINYDRMHTVFEHSAELASIYDFDNNTLTKRTEITYHNNYTNVLSLNLGIEARSKRIGRFEGFIGLGLQPGYVVSVGGKTLSERSVEFISLDNAPNKFSLSGGASAGLQYVLSRNVELGLGYYFNRTLIQPIFINNSVLTKQHQKISLSIGYRF